MVQWLRIRLPASAGDVGSIPGRGTKIPHAMGQLSPHAATTEPVLCRACAPRLESPHAATTEPVYPGARTTTREKPAYCNEKILHAATKIPCATTKTQRGQINK